MQATALDIDWVAVAAQVIGAASSIAGGIAGGRAASEQAQAQRRAVRLQAREELVQSYKDMRDIIGAQQAGFAAGNVMVGYGGTPGLLEEEMLKYTQRKQATIAEMEKHALKGAQYQAQTAKYAAYGQVAQGVAQIGAAGKSAGWWG